MRAGRCYRGGEEAEALSKASPSRRAVAHVLGLGGFLLLAAATKVAYPRFESAPVSGELTLDEDVPVGAVHLLAEGTGEPKALGPYVIVRLAVVAPVGDTGDPAPAPLDTGGGSDTSAPSDSGADTAAEDDSGASDTGGSRDDTGGDDDAPDAVTVRMRSGHWEDLLLGGGQVDEFALADLEEYGAGAWIWGGVCATEQRCSSDVGVIVEIDPPRELTQSWEATSTIEAYGRGCTNASGTGEAWIEVAGEDGEEADAAGAE